MDINKITSAASDYTYTSKSKATSTEDKTVSDDTAAVYEKSTSSGQDSYKVNNAELISQMQSDLESRTNQLQQLVSNMMTKQGNSYGTANDMWQFLASGDYTVTADVKAQAQKDTAEDGYWGATQTSDRILDFAKALSGGDSSKAEELRAAFEKGYKQATNTWGGELPSLCKDTYDQVMKKFDDWANGTESGTTEA